MRALVLSLAALAATPLHAEVRRLTLADAVELAFKVDPLVAESWVAKDRSKLAVLRAQLDRVSVKIDGSLKEQWNKFNIGGPAVCIAGGVALSLDPAACAAVGGSSSADSSGQGLFNLAARVTVPVFAGFRVDATVKHAQRADEAALVGVRQAQHDLALSVGRAYWSARRLGLLITVQTAALERLREAEAVAAARVRVGLAPPIDQNRAKQRRLQQVAAIEDLKGQLAEAAAQFAVGLGLPGDVELVDAPSMPAEAPSIEALLGDARSGRPELKTARLQLEMGRQNVRIARSNYYPQLGAFGLFQYGNNPLNTSTGSSAASSAANPFADLSGNLQLGGVLTMNFFDTLNTYTASRDAEYEVARLDRERVRLERVVESDVRLAHAKLRHLAAYRAPLAASQDVARDNLAIVEGRYKTGEGTILDLFDAQLALADAERQLADISAQQQIAWLELDAALGKIVGAR
jgi:outer membrane protein TolC